MRLLDTLKFSGVDYFEIFDLTFITINAGATKYIPTFNMIKDIP